jgi:hypothetical protein
VVVSVVHLRKGAVAAPMLDERPVRRISAYLVEGDLDASPASLAANAGAAFVGIYLLGLGFTFDDEAAAKGKASPVAEMHRLIAKDPRNAERIFPYLGGEEVNTSPTHAHHRWCIDFNDFPLRRDAGLQSWFLNEGSEACDKRRKEWRRVGIVPGDYPGPVAADWPDLVEIVRAKVKRERDLLGDNPDARRRRENWWKWGRYTPALFEALRTHHRFLALSRVGQQLAFTVLPAAIVPAETIVAVMFEEFASFACLQCRSHEQWSRFSRKEARIEEKPWTTCDSWKYHYSTKRSQI